MSIWGLSLQQDAASKIATEGGTARATWCPQVTNGPNGPERGAGPCHRRRRPRGIWWRPRVAPCFHLPESEGCRGSWGRSEEQGARVTRPPGLGLLSRRRPQMTRRLGCAQLTLLISEQTHTHPHTHRRAHVTPITDFHVAIKRATDTTCFQEVLE